MSPLTEGCLERYVKRLIRRTDMEDALNRLDKLTREEVRIAIAQNLKATHTVNERVRGVANTVVAIDNRVAGVDDRVAGIGDRVAHVDDRVAYVDDRVANVGDRVASVDDKFDWVIDGAQIIFSQAREISNFNRSDGKEAKQVVDQVRKNIHKWLSPPDPSTNHNIARGTQYKKAATWFFQGSIFREWKSTPSLLWIYGKRTPSHAPHPIPSVDVLSSSWLRQKCSLVGRCLALSIIGD